MYLTDVIIIMYIICMLKTLFIVITSTKNCCDRLVVLIVTKTAIIDMW